MGIWAAGSCNVASDTKHKVISEDSSHCLLLWDPYWVGLKVSAAKMCKHLQNFKCYFASDQQIGPLTVLCSWNLTGADCLWIQWLTPSLSVVTVNFFCAVHLCATTDMWGRPTVKCCNNGCDDLLINTSVDRPSYVPSVYFLSFVTI